MINHYTGIHTRVIGGGNLKLRLISKDEVREFNLADIPISNNGRDAFKLANFMEEQAQLEIKTTELGNYFSIRSIRILKKPVFTGIPG